MTKHLLDRLNDRNLEASPVVLETIAKHCGKTDTAVLLAELDRWVCGGGSSGEQVWLIVRGGRPITIMFRGKKQPLAGMKVEKFYRYAHPVVKVKED